MRVLTHCCLGLAGLILPTAMLLPAATAASSRTVAVTPASPSTFRAQDTVLVGSSKWLVFERAPALASAVDADNPDPDAPRPPDNLLVARTRGGHEVSLGHLRRDDVHWSVYGDWLAADRWESDHPTGTVDEWSLRTGHRRAVRLPSTSDWLLSAAPGGVLFTNLHGSLGQLQRSTGTVTTHGEPFGASRPYNGVGGPHGIVLYGQASAKYLTFSNLTRSHDLDTPSSDLICSSVGVSYAGCYDVNDTDDSLPADADLLVPLNGSPATVSSAGCDGQPAVAGSTLVWAGAPNGACANAAGDPTLQSLRADATKPVKSSTAIRGNPVSAYGKAVATQPASRAMLGARSATDSAVLFRERRSPVAAGAFSLSGGRLFDIDDQAEPAHPQAVLGVREQSVSATARSVHRAHRRVVARSSEEDQIIPGRVSASGQGVAYGVAAAPHETPAVVVRSPFGDVTIGNAETPMLAGRWLLYESTPSSGVGAWHLVNLSTHADTVVASLASIDNDTGYPPSVALCGHDLYTQSNHKLYVENLSTGHKTALATTIDPASLYAGSHYIAWSRRSYRSIAPGSAVKKIKGTGYIIGAGPAGLFVQRPAGTVALQRWSGKVQSLPGGSTYLAESTSRDVSPQLDGHLLVWINAHGRLLAARLG